MRISTEERRKQLIDAAVRVFKRDGVENAGLRAIATEAGASLAAVHVCFTDKNELMRGAAQQFLREFVDSMPEDLPFDEGIRAVVAALVDAYWKSLVGNPDSARAQYEIGTWSVRHEANRDVLRGIYEDFAEEAAVLLAKAARVSGEQSALPLTTLARGVVAIIDGCLLQHLGDPESPDPRRLCDTLVDGLLVGAGL